MSSDDAIQLLALFILILLSAFFSSAETALTTVNRIRIQTLAEEGNKRAKMVLKVADDPSKMLSTILIGNNLVNNFSAALATALAIRMFGNGYVGIVTGILTLIVLIFSEITPKTFAAANADRMALAYVSVILFLMKLMTPVIIIINSICHFFLYLLRVDPEGSMNYMTEEELRTIVDVSHKEGVIEEEEQQMIINVFDFGDSQAKDVMVPRADMVTISESATYREVWEIFHTEKYTRLPVYQNERDNIIGILNIKDFFFCDPATFKPTDLMYKPYFVYEHKKTSELLIEMRKNSISITIVLDEYGDSVGMISMEDLLEEIVGEIRDEYDDDEKNLIQACGEREYLIEGSVKLDDINDALDLNLSSEEYDTIGGLIIEHLDHIPEQNDSITTEDGVLLVVYQMDGNRIETVKMTLPDPLTEEPEVDSHEEN